MEVAHHQACQACCEQNGGWQRHLTEVVREVAGGGSRWRPTATPHEGGHVLVLDASLLPVLRHIEVLMDLLLLPAMAIAELRRFLRCQYQKQVITRSRM
jgi:hypothetical protein